ncbi:hypothetical protein D6774_02020 [Candidatus Woesearchaeota archaeon]|nr:MAG: hypothetical protein D6774_02020 [Candidatus Woesearchaeota archaeon]
MSGVLILNLCKEPLHFYEFVKPVEDILKKEGIAFKTIPFNQFTSSSACDKIIICGTSLKDDHYLDLDFSWIRSTSIPILGICAGCQMICLSFGAQLKKQTEIGYYKETFVNPFLGLRGEQEVYHLHNKYATLPKDFISFTESKIPQAIKHQDKEIYGVLFHPEVRNKEMILAFTKHR